jgi:hypothetical protein
MIAENSHDHHEREQELIQRIIAEMAEDLELARRTISRLNATIEALLSDSPPDEVAHALRSKGGRAQPIRMRVGGKARTFLVPALGMDDPVAQAMWWRRFTDQYGGGAC